MPRVHNKLKTLRANVNMSLREVSAETGISKSVLNALENGDRNLTEEHLRILADFYKVSYDYLLNRSEIQLKEMNIPDNKIQLMLSDDEFIQTLQKQALTLLTMIQADEDIEQVITLIVHLLNEEGIVYDDEIKKKYLK